MAWWVWVVIVVVVTCVVVDWFIVMGINPKEWKQNKKDKRR